MRRTALLVGLALAACGDDPAPAGPQPRAGTTQPRRDRAAPAAAPARPVVPTVESLGAWRPDAADLALAARLGDPVTRDEAWIEIGDLPRDRWVRVLRAGLRLDDARAAYQCAVELSWEHLDAAEMSRVCRLIFEANFDPSIAAPDDPESIAEPFEAASSADVAWLCERFLATPPEAWPSTGGLDSLHKSLRADAAAAVFRLAALPACRDDKEIQVLASQVLEHLDVPREAIAAILEPGLAAAAADGGLPPALASLLGRAVRDGEDRPSAAEKAWALRWLADSRPGPADIPLLRSLRDRGEFSTERLLLVLRDAAPSELELELRRFLPTEESGSPDEVGALLMEIAHATGRFSPERRIPAYALSSGDALALALAWDRRATSDAMLSEALDRESFESALLILNSPRDADQGRARHGLPLPDELVPGFFEALEPPTAWLAFDSPIARTARTADAILARLTALDFNTDRPPLGALGALEVHAPTRTAEALRAHRDLPMHDDAQFAGTCLARMGDEDALLFLLQCEWTEDVVFRPYRQFRGAGPRVREALVERLRDPRTSDRFGGVLSLVLCDLGRDGPRDLDFTTQFEVEPTEALRAATEHAVAGRPVDAILAICGIGEDILVEGMGAVRDPRIGAFLRSRLDARHTGNYHLLVGELALHGDEAARAEQIALIRAGHYRWIDEMPHLHRDLGDPLAALPLWIDVVESNCCQKTGAIEWIEDRFEIDLDAMRGPLETDASIVRDWFRRYRSRLRWSDIAGKYVVAPE